jgi:hypothetical protein
LFYPSYLLIAFIILKTAKNSTITIFVFMTALRTFKKKSDKGNHISRTDFATPRSIFDVNYVTLNRWSHLAICPVFSPKTSVLV